MESALIFSDAQVPYHDSRAWEVFLQIGEDLKPDILVDNGDFPDWRTIGKYPVRQDNKELINEWKHEIHIQRTMYKELVGRVKAKKRKKNDGNHEWRVNRALMNAGNAVWQLMGLPEISGAFTTGKVLGTDALGFEHSGEYPNGCWLFNAQPHNNVWVEHGYILSQKAGYTGSRTMEKRMSSTVNGHSERLAMGWRKSVGDRRTVALEGGCLSKIGEPKIGDQIYSSVPLNAAEYTDHQQGFLIIYRDGNDIFPFPLAIHHGKCVWNGRLYRA